MKKNITAVCLFLFASLSATAQTVHTENPLAAKYSTFSVIGDSYSTFLGKNEPVDNAQYYPREGLDVYEASQTWWMLFQRETGIRLEQNNSYSGGTICNTWWNGGDASGVSFVKRAQNLRGADLIIVEGGTNDSNAGSPIGSYKYENWTATDLKAFRPATAKTIDYLKNKFPEAQILFMLNNGLKADINNSVYEICQHYNVPVMTLSGVSKALEHPTYSGMQTISRQLVSTLLDGEGYTMVQDNQNQTFSTAVENAKVYFQMPFRAGEWMGGCLPFDLDSSQLSVLFGEGFELLAFTGETETSTETGGTNLVFQAVTSVERGVPYLVCPAITRNEGVIIDGFTLQPSTAQTIGDGAAQLVGVYRTTSIRPSAKSNYLIAPNLTVGNAEETTPVRPMHAYITTKATAPISIVVR